MTNRLLPALCTVLSYICRVFNTAQLKTLFTVRAGSSCGLGRSLTVLYGLLGPHLDPRMPSE